MADMKRRLTIFEESDDGTKIIVEFQNQEQAKEYRQQAEKHGFSWSEIGIEQYDRAIYLGCRYFDFRNPQTRKSFAIEDWCHFLKYWDENERNNEYSDYHI
jgi:hypothetical protein|tara:strand:+ start:523 stop:825 length:303 start_codon:yes stop_codon:yes gene_type:complete